MEISDIQKDNDKFILTFCNNDNYEDIITIKINKNDMLQISKFCIENKLKMPEPVTAESIQNLKYAIAFKTKYPLGVGKPLKKGEF